MLRIGTWNLEYASGKAKNAQRKRIIEQMNCDIWVLTETHDDIDLSPTHMPIKSIPRPERRVGERWVTIWSRFPSEPLGVADAHRTAAALVKHPKSDLIVFGTVLPWHSDRGSSPSGGAVRNWSEQYRVIPKQAKEWRLLVQRHREAALIVAGDLNMDIGGRHFYGTKQGRALLRQAMRMCNLICATETRWIPPGLLFNPPIDHVLIPAEWASDVRVARAWEGAQEGTRLSDHSGLAVEIWYSESEPKMERPHC